MFNLSFPISGLWYIPLAGKCVIQPGEWPLSASVKYAGKRVWCFLAGHNIIHWSKVGENLEWQICLSQMIWRHFYVSLDVPLGKWEGTSREAVGKQIRSLALCLSLKPQRAVFWLCINSQEDWNYVDWTVTSNLNRNNSHHTWNDDFLRQGLLSPSCITSNGNPTI